MAKPTAGPPRVWEVLYVHPNPDGSRKNCVNCPMWISGDPVDRCTIHGPKVLVTADMVCGYHVNGPPVAVHHFPRPPIKRGQYVEPELSGLERVPGGTSCDNCQHYATDGQVLPGRMGPTFSQGYCAAVANEAGNQATVEALGCCARWDERPKAQRGDLSILGRIKGPASPGR